MAIEQVELAAKPRTETGKGANRRLRAEGLVPGIVYGAKKEPVNVSVVPKPLVKILHSVRGKNTPLALKIEGESEPRLCIIKDMQVHPVRRTVRHVDFWEVLPDQRVVVDVPFKRVGRSNWERIGARVRLTRHDVKVRCKVLEIPEFVSFDMTDVPDGKMNIPISRVTMPEGVEAVYKHDYSIIQVRPPRAAKKAAAEADEKKK